MSFSYFILDGKKSIDFDLVITTDIQYNSTSYDIEQIEVEGRDGVLLKDKHRLKPVEQEIPMKLKTGGNAHRVAPEISNWLNQKGWRRLEFSWDKDHYYLVSFIEKFSVEEVLEVFGSLKANFLFHPIKFKKSGESQINLINGMTLTNLGNNEAKPKLIITGSGDGVITINNSTLTLKSVQDSLIVDSAKSMVYSGNLAAWNKIVRSASHYMPIFKVGDNKISWTGNFTIACVPNWGDKL